MDRDPSISIRPATPADIPLILQLVYELATYERAPEQAVATPALMQRALFGDPARDGKGAGIAECVIGEIDGTPQGLALWFHHFSSWTGRPGLYLEDLFVRPAARGKGLGKALFVHLARLAVGRGCARYEWTVVDWNTPAIEFYTSLGARAMDQWTVFRLDEEGVERLAEKGKDA